MAAEMAAEMPKTAAKMGVRLYGRRRWRLQNTDTLCASLWEAFSKNADIGMLYFEWGIPSDHRLSAT